MGTGRDMLFYVCRWVRALGLGGYDINGRNEWRKLIFILRIYKWNFHLCLILILIFRSFFRSLVIFDLSNLNLAQHVYSSPS